MKKVWAIARVTIAQALRMRLPVVLIVFLIVMVPALPFLLKTEQSLLSRLRVIMTYCMYLIIFLMSLVTLFLSCGVLANEIKQKQIYILDTKPVPRWQVLAGKWLGIMVLNAALLFVMGCASYVILRYLGNPGTTRPALLVTTIVAGALVFLLLIASVAQWAIGYRGKWLKRALVAAVACAVVGAGAHLLRRVTPPSVELEEVLALEERLRELEGKPLTRDGMRLMRTYQVKRKELAERAQTQGQILVARASARPEIPNLDHVVEAELQRLTAQGMTVPEKTADWHRKQLRKLIIHAGFVVTPRNWHEWVITGLPKNLGPRDMITIRYLHYASEKLQGVAVEEMVGEWKIGSEAEGTRIWEQETRSPSGTVHEFLVPGDCVSKTGKLVIRYTNMNPYPRQRWARFPYDNGLEVLYPVGTVEANFCRGLGLIFIWLGFLAILGLASASFLGFPVAVFLCLVVLGISLSIPLWEDLAERIYIIAPDRPPGDVAAETDVYLQRVVRTALYLFPDFRQCDPVPLLVEGRVVPLRMFLTSGAIILLIRGGLLALLGGWLFWRRELAADVS